MSPHILQKMHRRHNSKQKQKMSHMRYSLQQSRYIRNKLELTSDTNDLCFIYFNKIHWHYLNMIKTFVFVLLFVATISLTLHHCSSGYTYVITLGKCEPISKLCSVNQYYDKKHHACYTKSLQCSVGQTYDSKTHKCIAINTKCSKGYVFSKQLQHCVKKIVCSAGYVLNKQYQVC